MALRVIKLLIASLFWLIDTAHAFVLRTTGRTVPWTFSVLMYHAIKDDEVSAFANQMDTLRKLTDVVSSEFEAADAIFGKAYAAVTFDDGYDSFFDNALPVLTERGIPAMVFVTTGYPSLVPEWITDMTHRCASERLMGLGRLTDVARRGVGIGSHSVSHPRLAELPAQEVVSEMTESRKTLERALGRQVRLFAFPFGSYNEECLRLATLAGYDRVFLSEPLRSPANMAGPVVGRVGVEPSDWPLEFTLKALGAYRWLQTAIVLKSRVRQHVRLISGAKAHIQ